MTASIWEGACCIGEVADVAVEVTDLCVELEVAEGPLLWRAQQWKSQSEVGDPLLRC